MDNSPPKNAGDRRNLSSTVSVAPSRRERSSPRALWPLGLLAFLLAAGLAVVWLARQPAGLFKQGDRTRELRALQSAVPRTPFVDITSEAGIRFVHENGAAGEKLLPETMGGGCAFFDFDNDGHPDILLINSGTWPWDERPGPLPTMALYRNDGTGTFADVTAGSGLDVSLYGMGVAMGDYDNDGWVDVFITAVGGNRLFRNLGNGQFEDVTGRAGVGGGTDTWSTSAAWFDYNNDGKLDLFVCNYVQWSRELDFEVDYRLVGIGRAYGPPMNFPGTFPYLYRNEGDDRFTDVSQESSVQVRTPGTGAPMAKSLGVAPVDLDGDGWIDLIVANDTVQNFVFHNQGDGTFKEMGALSGIAYDIYGGTRGAMGIDSSRFEEDTQLAVAIGNFANEMTALYVAQRDPFIFTDEALAQGIGSASREALTFGVFFFDYDLDGWQDLLTVNGHVEPEIHRVQATQSYRQPAQLFWNARGTHRREAFVPVPSDKTGAALFTPLAGRGSAFADIDGDGDLDVLFVQVGAPPLLLRNDQQLGHNWVRFVLTGTRANRDAIGAWIRLRAGNRTWTRQVMPTRGYLSQSELPITFGLGRTTRVDEVQITWPDGTTQRLASVPLNQTVRVEQPR
jgi:enediyne biosynthesis protein E4